jgi:hypothetical protein
VTASLFRHPCARSGPAQAATISGESGSSVRGAAVPVKGEGRNPGRPSHRVPAFESGAGNRVRTGDPQLGKRVHRESRQSHGFASAGNCW